MKHSENLVSSIPAWDPSPLPVGDGGLQGLVVVSVGSSSPSMFGPNDTARSRLVGSRKVHPTGSGQAKLEGVPRRAMPPFMASVLSSVLLPSRLNADVES